MDYDDEYSISLHVERGSPGRLRLVEDEREPTQIIRSVLRRSRIAHIIRLESLFVPDETKEICEPLADHTDTRIYVDILL